MRKVDRALFPDRHSALRRRPAGRVDEATTLRRVPGQADSGARRRMLGGQAEALARRLREKPMKPALFALILRFGDALVLLLGGLILFRLALPGGTAGQSLILLALASGVLLTTSALSVLGAYRFRRLRSFLIGAGLLTIALPLGLLLSAIFLFVLGYPLDRLIGWLTLWGLLAGAVMLMIRMAVALRIRHLTRTGAMEHRIVMLGGGPALVPAIREIDRERNMGRRLCGFFDERRSPRSPDLVNGYHKLGDLDDLVEFCRLAHIDTVVLAMPDASKQRLLELSGRLAVLPVDVRLICTDVPPWLAGSGKERMGRLGRLRTVTLHKRPVDNWQAFQKRTFDLVFASFAMVLLAPVMVGVALAVRLESPGPILFRQKRHGYNNKPIWVWKFRSMYADQCDPTAVRAVRRHDNRVTRVGRIIRRTSIDELPQIFNVLGGEMSLVGPRPHATAARTGDIIYDTIADSYAARHRVKPGITGWAQINGWRGELNSPEKIRARVEHDLYYIEHWSLWLDFRILLCTPASLILTRNAY